MDLQLEKKRSLLAKEELSVSEPLTGQMGQFGNRREDDYQNQSYSDSTYHDGDLYFFSHREYFDTIMCRMCWRT
jgi:hypothetical protein